MRPRIVFAAELGPDFTLTIELSISLFLEMPDLVLSFNYKPICLLLSVVIAKVLLEADLLCNPLKE